MAEPTTFLREFARDRATVAHDIDGGFVVRNAEYPLAYDHNTARISQPVDPARLLVDLERTLGELGHRRCEVDGAGRTGALAAALAGAGYTREPELVMTATRTAAADRPAPDDLVRAVDIDERVALTATWPDDAEVDPEVRRQLAERIRTAVPAADCTFLVVRDDAGQPVARADLFLRDDTAQIEEVVTLAAARGQGHASRLVAAGRALATDRGATAVFLVADADDWPRRLYDRLGFDVTDDLDVWTRVVD